MEGRRVGGAQMLRSGLVEEVRRGDGGEEGEEGGRGEVRMVKSESGDGGWQRNGQGERHLRQPCRRQPKRESIEAGRW